MTVLNSAGRTLLTGNHLAHLVTLNADGSPQASIVWAGLDGDEIVIASLSNRQKLRNVRRDPRVVITFETDRLNERGLTEYLTVHGTGRVTDGGAPEVLQELARTYIGPGAVFPPGPNPPPGHLLHVTVDRVGGVGPWADSQD